MARTFDGDDRLCVDGERLWPQPETDGDDVYRREHDDFSLYRRHGSTTNPEGWFEVRTADGFGPGAEMIELSSGPARWIRASERNLILRHMDLNRSPLFPEGLRPPFKRANH